MSNVVHLKWGEEPAGDLYLMITRVSRVRGQDFYVRSSAEREIAAKRAEYGCGFASLASALREAETRAQSCGVETIYVQQR
jgi:hypothetical protein